MDKLENIVSEAVSEAEKSVAKAEVYADIVRSCLVSTNLYYGNEYVKYTFDEDVEAMLRKIHNMLDEILD